MDQVITGLRSNPNNYFHYVVGDIIWSINQYLIPPAMEEMWDKIIQEVIVPACPLELVDLPQIKYDFQVLFYRHLGVGPTGWMYQGIIYNIVSEFFELRRTDLYCDEEITRLLLDDFTYLLPIEISDDFDKKLHGIIRQYLLTEALMTSEYQSYHQKLAATRDFQDPIYGDREPDPVRSVPLRWVVPAFTEAN